MSKTCEHLAASVKHFDKLCACMHGCARVSVFDVCAAPVVKIWRFLCQQIDIVAFRVLSYWYADAWTFHTSHPTRGRADFARHHLGLFFSVLVLQWYNISAVPPVSCTKCCFLGSSVRVIPVRMNETEKTDTWPRLWRERLQARIREGVLVFWWQDDRNVTHCF